MLARKQPSSAKFDQIRPGSPKSCPTRNQPNSAKFGLGSTETCPTSARVGPTSTGFRCAPRRSPKVKPLSRSNMGRLRQNLARVPRSRPKFGRILATRGPNSGQLRSVSTEFGRRFRIPARSGRSPKYFPASGQIWPKSGQCRMIPGQLRAKSGQLWLISGQVLVDSRPNLAESG